MYYFFVFLISFTCNLITIFFFCFCCLDQIVGGIVLMMLVVVELLWCNCSRFSLILMNGVNCWFFVSRNWSVCLCVCMGGIRIINLLSEDAGRVWLCVCVTKYYIFIIIYKTYTFRYMCVYVCVILQARTRDYLCESVWVGGGWRFALNIF